MSNFKINRKTDYAIRVVLAMAMHPFGTRLSSQAIQEETLVPQAFLYRIIAQLSQANLIETFTGPKGGLQLARRADEITLLDIVQVIDGPIMISDCLISKEECPLAEKCPVRSRWGGLQATILRQLDRTTIAHLVVEASNTESWDYFPPAMDRVEASYQE